MDFKQAKQRRERGVSVSDLLKGTIESDYDNLIMIGWNDGDETEIGYSASNSYESVSRLEIAKYVLLNEGFFVDD